MGKRKAGEIQKKDKRKNQVLIADLRVYLGLHVSVVVTLQQERSGLGVVFAGSDVQCR